MSAKEVTTLRKQGKLTEAYELAKDNLKIYPDDIWNKRAISWVYYEYMKNAVTNRNSREFLIQLKNIKNLELPKSEKYVFDSVAWQVGKLLFPNQKFENIQLDELFSGIKDFTFSKPSDSYSFMLKAFKKHANEWSNYLQFIDWWGLDNFQEKDFQNYVLDNGSKTPSLVESIYISISKKLLNPPIDIDKIKDFIPKIAAISTTYTQMQYPAYYYAKLLITLGDREHFMKAFLPFAKKKGRDFWVWNLMSENFDITSDEYFSCLCKAASCHAPDKFTGDLREKLGSLFIKKERYAEAKFEFQKIINVRNKEGWALRDKHLEWQNLSWWSKTEATTNNRKLYEQNIQIAENLLYADIPEVLLVVERVNKEKTVLNFVVSKQLSGFFNYSRLNITPKVGDIYAARFEERKDKTSNFYRVKSIIKTGKEPNNEIYKHFLGDCKIKQSNSFGFVNNVFIPPQIISLYKLKSNDQVKGIALQTYNSKRKAWGWSVIKIEK